MNARSDFLKGTNWEADYVSGLRADSAIVGYRGPFPTGDKELDTARSALAHLFDTPAPAQLNGLVNMAASADRLIIGWREEGAVGILAARSVAALGLKGWHLTVVAVEPRFRGRKLLPELVRVLASEEPVDFLSVITNEETVYRAVAFACPGGVAHPNRAGRHGRPIRPIAEAVIDQLPGASALPPLGPDLTWRGLVAQPNPATNGDDDANDTSSDNGDGTTLDPNDPGDGKSRFRASLKLTSSDAAFVVGDLSGVIGIHDRARKGLPAVDVKHRLRTITVTGTNGKTSTVEFGRQLTQSAGLEAASFGTLGAITRRGRTRSPRMATGRPAMPQFADRLWALGHDVLWSEGYSYALSRALFDHIPVDVGVFTQFGFDHFSMHRSLAAYWAAKERLFKAIVGREGTIVLDPSTEGADRILAIAGIRKLKVLTTGTGNTVEITNQG
ncbi:MAG: hypothetical protein GY724_14615, partial [Actinomycetia bacterium]|nr:hypothetical protein [Actinomycetes bacterium]